MGSLRQTRRTRFHSPSLQTFNFAGWGDAPVCLEPLLFYVLHRAANEIADPAKLGRFKTFLLDEAWLFIQNEVIRDLRHFGAEDVAQT